MKQLSKSWTHHRLERGQSLVEMSLGFVLLLIVLSGLVDVGRACIIYVALEDAAGEAALYLSIDPECTNPPGLEHPEIPIDCLDPNNAEYRARNAGGANIDWTNADITIEVPSNSVGNSVLVTINYQFNLLSPFMPRFAGVNPVTLTVSASNTIIRET